MMITIKKILRKFVNYTWNIWEKLGYFLVEDHFYNPIPSTKELNEKQPWNDKYTTEGIDMRVEEQLLLLDEIEKYMSEYKSAGSPFEANGDGPVLHAMVRKCSPDHIIEIGSGKSTRVSLEASALNADESGQKTNVIAVEPYPDDTLKRLEEEYSNLTLRQSRAEAIPVNEYISLLGSGDILFIDGSHVLRVGNDVNHLYLKVIPQLPVGTYVHIHDIRFPYEYPKSWLLKKHRFWTEQYLLQSFLAFNNSFKVIWSGNWMSEMHGQRLEEILPNYETDGGWPGSFWIKRVD